MTLADLLQDSIRAGDAVAAIEAKGVTADSRAVKPGDVFFALAGTKADGSVYARAAIAAGAVAVVVDRPLADKLTPPVVHVDNARRALAMAASRLYARQPAVIAAVTGTSGKTSVAAFTRQIWQSLGHAAASIGTVGIITPSREVYGSLTTPDPVALHRSIDELAGEGITHLALEASSHGLDQHRLDGVRVAAAGFTNLSRDHLDYHPTVEDYLAAKLRLFSDLVQDGGTAVIDVDHEHAAAVVKAASARGLNLLTVGRSGDGFA